MMTGYVDSNALAGEAGRERILKRRFTLTDLAAKVELRRTRTAYNGAVSLAAGKWSPIVKAAIIKGDRTGHIQTQLLGSRAAFLTTFARRPVYPG
jgi:hypothetical protein